MRPRLYTEIPKDGDNWRFVRSGPSGLEPVPEGAGIPSGADVVVFVPGTEVTAHRVRAAARRPVELTRLATFAIEDDLAVPVESVHVAVSADQDDAGFRIVYAVSHTVMQHWLDQLEAAGLGSARIVPDLSLLPPTEQVDFGRYQLLTVEGRPVAFDNGWPSDVMSALLKGTEANAAPRRAESLTELALWAEAAPRLTDLRQGTYARASETGLSLKQFRLPAALAATLFVAWGAQTALSVHTMKNLTATLDAESRAQYAAAFPGQPVPPNPAAALRSRTGAATSVAAPSFQQTSAALYGAVESVSGANLVSLRYDRAIGELRATLTYPAFGADLDLKTAIEATGLQVSLGDTRLEDGRVVGDLSIGGRS